MSPELVLGTPVDRRSDLFGVGVCLYEMVTGKRLFAGSDDIATLKLLRNATVPPPSEMRDDTPDELETIIMRSLARDPEQDGEALFDNYVKARYGKCAADAQVLGAVKLAIDRLHDGA